MARVLIADDHQDTLQILTAELAADGHEVIVADSGLDLYTRALEIAPDLILLGPSLTIHDGYECASMLRADPDVPDALPIVMLGSTDLDHRRLEKARVTETLSRGHSASELRELVSRILFV